MHKFEGSAPGRSFMQQLTELREAAQHNVERDPWAQPLRRLKGRVGHDGVERLSTHEVFDVLEVPMRQRASKTVHASPA